MQGPSPLIWVAHLTPEKQNRSFIATVMKARSLYKPQPHAGERDGTQKSAKKSAHTEADPHVSGIIARPRSAKRALSGVLPIVREGAQELIHLRVPGELTYRDLITRAVTKCCKVAVQKRHELTNRLAPPDFTHELVSAVGEAFNNVVLHAYDGTEAGAITMVLRFDANCVEVEVQDCGHSFDPDDIPEPDLSELPEGGMGLFIMKAFVDEVRYDAGEPNVLLLRKYFEPRP